MKVKSQRLKSKNQKYGLENVRHCEVDAPMLGGDGQIYAAVAALSGSDHRSHAMWNSDGIAPGIYFIHTPRGSKKVVKLR